MRWNCCRMPLTARRQLPAAKSHRNCEVGQDRAHWLAAQLLRALLAIEQKVQVVSLSEQPLCRTLGHCTVLLSEGAAALAVHRPRNGAGSSSSIALRAQGEVASCKGAPVWAAARCRGPVTTPRAPPSITESVTGLCHRSPAGVQSPTHHAWRGAAGGAQQGTAKPLTSL